MTSNLTRRYFIDNLRGVLILLVILGHCIQSVDSDFDHNIVFRAIYACHMPLFMYISGFVSYKEVNHWVQIKRRLVQLIIPFVAWAALNMTLSNDFNWDWILQPDTGLWFLWVLFWISVIYVSMSKLSNKLNIAEESIFAIGCLGLLAIGFIGKQLFGLYLIAWYLPFFLMGVASRKYEKKLFPLLSQTRLLLVAGYFIGAFFWMRNESPTFMTTNSPYATFAYKFLVGTIGCFCFMSIFILWKGRGLLISELGGGMTLGIYAIHQPIIQWLLKLNDQLGFIQPSLWPQVGALFTITLLLTLLTYFLLFKIKITRIIFIGK